MRILHLCLACFYIDGYAYQENLLPKYHKKLGNEVGIIASTQTYVDNVSLGYVEPSEYINADGIKVKRISYSHNIPQKLNTKLRIYEQVEESLEEFKPDIIFVHDIQFLSLKELVYYKKRNPKVIILADCHADYINSAKTFLSKNILHKWIYRRSIKKAEPYIEKFYGTLPCRCNFLKEVYGIPESKIEYLPFGADDEMTDKALMPENRNKIRKKYGINEDEFVLVTGGKINKQKMDILLAMDAVCECDIPARLIVFGSIADDVKDEFKRRIAKNKIIYAGWADVRQSYDLMGAADAAVFPCLHSTLWEQAAGVGLPCIIHHIEGYTHININENCFCIETITKENIIHSIAHVYQNILCYKKRAEEGKRYFSYKRIAELTLKTEDTSRFL